MYNTYIYTESLNMKQKVFSLLLFSVLLQFAVKLKGPVRMWLKHPFIKGGCKSFKQLCGKFGISSNGFCGFLI